MVIFEGLNFHLGRYMQGILCTIYKMMVKNSVKFYEKYFFHTVDKMGKIKYNSRA